MNDIEKVMGVVTCEYCKYYRRTEYNDKKDIFELTWGWCEKYNSKKWSKAEICKEFVIIPGYHTAKWYPNKKKDGPSIF